jgi:hypothetical protein
MKQYLPLIIASLLLAALLTFDTSLDITGGAHTKTIFGQTWTLDANPVYGYSQYQCGSIPRPFISDQSNSTFLKLYGSIPNTGSSDCAPYTIGGTITLQSIDLRDYERVIIRRKLVGDINTKGTNTITTDTMGITTQRTITAGAQNIVLDNVIITQQNDIITVQTAQGNRILIAENDTLRFTDQFSIQASAPQYGGSFSYTITELQLTPKNNPTTNTTTTPWYYYATATALLAAIATIALKRKK